MLGVCLVIVPIVAALAPWKEQTYSMCLYCGASESELRILAVPVFSEETEGTLAQYWRRNIDARHQHKWAPRASKTIRAFGSSYADYGIRSPVHTVLDDETVVAIVSALPSPSARLKFMDILVGSWQGTSVGEARKTARKLQDAYHADPNRKDWPEILRELGCYPDTGGKP